MNVCPGFVLGQQCLQKARAAAGVVVACLVLTGLAHAGAWTQDAGHGQVIFTSSLFRTGTMYDENGEPAPFGYGGQFHQFILNPYFEYGLTARNTLVVNGSAPWLQFQNNYGKQSSAGLGDIEVAFKRRLNSTESHWAVSSQLTVMFPAYPADRNPAPGNHQVDVEGRFLLGRGLTLGHRHGFYDIEAAYRYRNGAPADQVRADASAGLEVVRRVTLMGQFFAIKSMRNGDPATPNSNPNAQSDFDLYKYQPSIVFAVGHGTKIQGGFCGAFSGRNTGAGHTAILALWKSF